MWGIKIQPRFSASEHRLLRAGAVPTRPDIPLFPPYKAAWSFLD